jgi:hypothetical protein
MLNNSFNNIVEKKGKNWIFFCNIISNLCFVIILLIYYINRSSGVGKTLTMELLAKYFQKIFILISTTKLRTLAETVEI